VEQPLLEKKLETVSRGQVVFSVVWVLLSLVAIVSIFEGEFVGLLFSIYVVPFLIGMAIVSWAKTFTTVQVFDDRVEVLNRFLVKSSRRIEASKIESVDFSQSLLGRSRYGLLTVRGAGTQAIVVQPVKEPEAVAEAIRGISDKSSSKSAPVATATTSSETQSLSELIQMKEQGHLTDDEFAAAKKKLLG
jgi:uncharacterized membrane protein YdbT with pleckstrin-like domain